MLRVLKKGTFLLPAILLGWAAAWAGPAQTIAEWSEADPARSDQKSVVTDGRVLTYKTVGTNKRHPDGTAVMFAVNLADVGKFEKATFQEEGSSSSILIKVRLKPGKKASNMFQDAGKPLTQLPPLDEGFNISFAPSKAALRDEAFEKLVRLIRH